MLGRHGVTKIPSASGVVVPKEIVPERAMMAAILLRAVCDLAVNSDCPMSHKRNAFAWIRGEIDNAEVTYAEVCESLDLCQKKMTRLIFKGLKEVKWSSK